MGQSVHPIGYRLGYNRKWNNLSFLKINNNQNLLFKDLEMINYLEGVFSYNKFIIDTPYILRENKDINIFVSYFNILGSDKQLKLQQDLNSNTFKKKDLNQKNKLSSLANFKDTNFLSTLNSKVSSEELSQLLILIKELILEYKTFLNNNLDSSSSNEVLKKYLYWLNVYKSLSTLTTNFAPANNSAITSINKFLYYKNLLKNKNKKYFNRYYLLKLNNQSTKKIKFHKPLYTKFHNLAVAGGTNLFLKKERSDNFKLINALKLQIKKTLKNYTSSNINLYIKPCDTFVGLPFTNAAILAKLLAYYNRTNKGNYLRFIKHLFKMAAKLKTISGLQVTVTGRSQSSARSKQIVYKYGRVPTQSLKANIDYYYTKTLDRSGISGIKVWVYGSNN